MPRGIIANDWLAEFDPLGDTDAEPDTWQGASSSTNPGTESQQEPTQPQELRFGTGEADTIPNRDATVDISFGRNVAFAGFIRPALDGQYFEDVSRVVHGLPTYWRSDDSHFIYYDARMSVWSISSGQHF